MATEKITIHTMKIASGEEIKYARILRKNGTTTIGQSVLLHRLSQEQRRLAIENSSKNQCLSNA